MNTTTIIPEIITMNDLVQRAGSNVPPVRVVFEGKVFDGTFAYVNDPLAAVDAFKDAVFSAFEHVERTEQFPGYTLDEVAIALDEVLNRQEGGVPQIVKVGLDLPSTRRVSVGWNIKTCEEMHRVVPGGAVSIPGFRQLDKKTPAYIRVFEQRGVVTIYAMTVRDDQSRLDGIFGYIRDWASVNTIYAGQAIDLNFNFLNLTNFKPHNVALTEKNQDAIDLLVREPFKNKDRLDADGLSPKTSILFYGPPGGGKTLTATLAEYIVVLKGGIVIHVDPSLGVAGLTRADAMAKRLLEVGHVVMIVFEDVEKLAREDRAKVLEILDGAGSKTTRRIVIGTTNFLEKIDRAMIRPGRFDAPLFCGLPDLHAFTMLVNVLVSEGRRGDIAIDDNGHYANAFPAFEGYSYAMIDNAVSFIKRSAIRNSEPGQEALISDEDLIRGANMVRDHHNLLMEDVVEDQVTFEELYRQALSPDFDNVNSNVMSYGGDHTDYSEVYDRARDAADSVVEYRINNATLYDEDRDRSVGQIQTN